MTSDLKNFLNLSRSEVNKLMNVGFCDRNSIVSSPSRWWLDKQDNQY